MNLLLREENSQLVDPNPDENAILDFLNLYHSILQNNTDLEQQDFIKLFYFLTHVYCEIERAEQSKQSNANNEHSFVLQDIFVEKSNNTSGTFSISSYWIYTYSKTVDNMILSLRNNHNQTQNPSDSSLIDILERIKAEIFSEQINKGIIIPILQILTDLAERLKVKDMDCENFFILIQKAFGINPLGFDKER